MCDSDGCAERGLNLGLLGIHSREEHTPEAGTVRQTNSGFQIFLPALLPRLLRQELQRCDPPDIMLQPFVRIEMAGPAPHRLPDSLSCSALILQNFKTMHAIDAESVVR
jgi:hypothetical protein